jgi:hypothetical protein
MIGQNKAVSHTREVLKYALGKNDSQVVSSSGLMNPESWKDTAKEMKRHQDLNTRCENNTFRIEISPAKADVVNWKHWQWEDLAEKVIQKSGLEGRQYVAVLHQDTDNPHLHIVANRVDHKGEAMDDQFCSNRMAQTAQLIAEEMNMTIANNVKRTSDKGKKDRKVNDEWKDFEKLDRKKKKKLLREGFRGIISNEEYGKEKVFKMFEALREKGIHYKLLYHKDSRTGEDVVYGAKIIAKGFEFKASDIDKRLGAKKIRKTFDDIEDRHSKFLQRKKDEEQSQSRGGFKM